MAGDDIDKLVQQDTRRVKRAWRNRGGFREITIGDALQNLFWVLAIASAVFMILSMPWVGESKLIPGGAWLGFSLGGMAIFAGLAFVIGHINREVQADIKPQRQDAGKGR